MTFPPPPRRAALSHVLSIQSPARAAPVGTIATRNPRGTPTPRFLTQSCAMESDAFVSVCDGSSGQPQVFIVDLKNGNQVMKRPMSAEAAIMNPARRGVPSFRGWFPFVAMHRLHERL